jgi:hypothetical protein
MIAAAVKLAVMIKVVAKLNSPTKPPTAPLAAVEVITTAESCPRNFGYSDSRPNSRRESYNNALSASDTNVIEKAHNEFARIKRR